MGRRFVGAVIFLVPAMMLFHAAGRLASEGRDGWGWFLLAGLVACGVSLNLWTGEFAPPPIQDSGKPLPTDDLD